MKVWNITYLGHVIDQRDDYREAVIVMQCLVRDVMADKLPDFLTSEDFEDADDCANSFHVVEVEA